MITKDLTSTSTIVSSEDIKMMPVDNMQAIVNLQAGVVNGHFRGGRSDEVAYLVDGIPVNDVFNGSLGIEVENSSIRQIEVISGTFNAEYGQALSGVVNIVTQDGSQNYEGTASAYIGNYFTDHTDIFWNLNKVNTSGPKDLQFSLSGPTKLLDGLTFLLQADILPMMVRFTANGFITLAIFLQQFLMKIIRKSLLIIIPVMVLLYL